MTINRSELGAHNAFINEFQKLRRDFDEYKATPQPIGNGSMNYAIFAPFTAGPFTIPAGFTSNVGLKFMDDTATFTYDGKEAIKRATLIDLVYSITVDVDDLDHIMPYGQLLTSNQRLVRSSWWCDYYASGLSETSGQRYINIQLQNQDTATHNYYIHGTVLLPRPALKPQ